MTEHETRVRLQELSHWQPGPNTAQAPLYTVEYLFDQVPPCSGLREVQGQLHTWEAWTPLEGDTGAFGKAYSPRQAMAELAIRLFEMRVLER